MLIKMTERPTLIDNMKRIVNQKGKRALERAKTELYLSFPNDDLVSKAIKHFAGVTLRDALPIFPALMFISCEAVGGKTEKTTSIGVAIVLITGAADVHDDVIDNSPTKGGKRTVFGKFGKELAILVGDVLLIHGIMRLQKECDSVPGVQGRKILDLVARAVFDISIAEALEARMRAQHDLSPKTYFEVIELKSVVPELIMKIGAILGNGNAESVEKLGHFGRIFGIVSTVAEEFMDILEPKELQNRLRNECPPLPCLLALHDPSVRKRVFSSKNKSLTKKNFEEIKGLVLNSIEANRLKKDMSFLVQTELDTMSTAIKNNKARKELKTLLTSSLEILQGLDG